MLIIYCDATYPGASIIEKKKSCYNPCHKNFHSHQPILLINIDFNMEIF